MTTDQETTPTEPGDPTEPGEPGAGRQPDWWHRDHPTFTALTGFFSGLAFVVLVPGLFIAALHVLVDDETAEQLFPFVLVTLAVPIGLVIAPRTRRFGTYMLIGVTVTALVVCGVAALVLWYMISHDR
jgi:4-amino-4-deoxy-L-arabinose transferase-like glycosyltransferase